MLLFGMYYRNHLFSKYLNVQSGKVEKWKSSSSAQTFYVHYIKICVKKLGQLWLRLLY